MIARHQNGVDHPLYLLLLCLFDYAFILLQDNTNKRGKDLPRLFNETSTLPHTKKVFISFLFAENGSDHVIG